MINIDRSNLHFKRHKITIMHFILKFIFIFSFGIFLMYIGYIYNDSQLHQYFLVPSTLIIIHVAFLSLILNYIKYFNNLVIISNERIVIINSTLFLKDDIEVIDISKITKLNIIKRGLFTNIFNYGKICIEQQKDEPTNLHFVPDPYNIMQQIKRKTNLG